MLLDRATLSKSKKWIDDDGRIYVFYRQEEVQDMLNIGVGKTVKIFNELEEFGLIIRKKLGQGKPTKIYVMNFAEEISESESDTNTTSVDQEHENETEVLTFENRKSEKCENKEFEAFDNEMEVKTSKNRKSAPSKIESLPFLLEKNKTEYSKTESSSSDDEKTKWKSEGTMSASTTRISWNSAISHIKEQIDYQRIQPSELLDEIVRTMAWVYTTPKKEIPVSGVLNDTSTVVERLKQITGTHVKRLMEDFREAKTKVKSPQNYLLTCLFNAPLKDKLEKCECNSSFDLDELDDLALFLD